MLTVMAVAAIAFSSCNGNKTADSEAADSTAVENVDSAVALDPEALIQGLTDKLTAGNAEELEAAVEDAQSAVDKLIADGKIEEAKTYAEKIKTFVQENKEKLKATGNSAIATFVDATEKFDVNNIGKAAEDAVNTINATLVDGGADAMTDVKEGASKVVNDAKSKAEAVNNKVQEVKQQAENTQKKAEEIQQKVNNAPEATKKAVEDIKNNAKENVKNLLK